MLTSSRYYLALFAMLVAFGAVMIGGSLTPSVVSADHDDDYEFCDPYYDQFDDDCHDGDHDFCDDDYNCDDVFGGHNDDYAGFLSMVASPSTINCGSTTHITVDIGSYYGYHHSDHGHHYYDGVTVGLAANVPGTIAPATLQTTVNGRAIFSYTAPATYKGPVYLSASTEFLTSSLILQVNCNITQPSAPPISAAPGGTAIQPPRTGDGGLIDDNAGGPPVAFAAAALASLGFLFASRRVSRER
jgi:hypothetical protein